jgi:hypothetical protein
MKLTNIKAVLDAGGVSTVEVDGWQTRGRSTDGGEYKTGRPDHIVVHHTAGSTGASAAAEVKYMVSTSDVAPVANLYISREGECWIMAAGSTNTNGKGSAPWTNGLVKDDDMNRHAIGIELGSNGIGEPYTEAAQECLTLTILALMDAYNIPLEHARSHAEWSPGRKIDPAGPAKWQPAGGTWNMDNFRGYLWTRLGDDTAPDPAPPTDDVIIAEPGDSAWSLMRKCGLDPAAIGAKGRDEWYALNYRVYPGTEVKRP